MSEEREEERSAWCRTLIVPVITVSVAIILSICGWGLAVETRLQRAMTIVDERGPRLINMEKNISELFRLETSPDSKAETKVILQNMQDDIERLQEQITRLEDRLNNLHSFMLTNPLLRPPFGQKLNPVNR